MKAIAVCNLPDGIKLDHAWFVAEDGLYAQKVAIRQLPQKNIKDRDKTPTIDYETDITLADVYNHGWNDCLNEITGETE